MHIKRLRISNFRSIDEIDVQFDALINVIIGPNAVGKSTILEAIRLAKAVLAPRTANETTQVLMSLGAMSPHLPQRLLPKALSRDLNRNLAVKCTFQASDNDIAALKRTLPALTARLAQQSVGLTFANPAQATAFFGSPQGTAAMQQAQQFIDSQLPAFEKNRQLDLNLTIDFPSSTLNGENQLHQIFYASIEQALDPSKTLFSYFPADRAMPFGEQQVQLGAADTAQQLESYSSQPQIKYNRLKTLIFNTIVSGKDKRDALKNDFDIIFQKVLRGRALGETGVNEIGMLSIPIIDLDSKAEFEIDGLSSGEKGLILTSLLISTTVAKDGLILLDEPELHLNPAVCRDLLQFFADEFAAKSNIQGIICSHSAEILAGALDRDNCALFHLRSGRALAEVRRKDRGEIRDALRRLGSSESEALLYKGTLSVEGIHDVEILQTGFDDLFRRFKIKTRDGRTNIEKDIEELQKAEGRGDEIGFHFFLFDHDRKPTSLKDSKAVKLLQLKRYCLENYLLDVEILTDLSREAEFSKTPMNNVTEMRDALKDIALDQLHEVVSRHVFKELGLEDVGFDMDAVKQSDALSVAHALWNRIDKLNGILGGFSDAEFKTKFQQRYSLQYGTLKPIWDENWRDLADGKKLLVEARKRGIFQNDLLRLKKRVISEMRNRRTETWSALESSLRDLIGPAIA